MKFIFKILLSALLVAALANLLPGVRVNGYLTAVWVALIISLLNVLVKPILVLLTLPITIITLGLFLLVINTLIILLTDSLLDGFNVRNFWWAFLFSLLLSIGQSLLFSILDRKKKG